MHPLSKLALVIAGSFSADENADPGSLLNYLPDELACRCDIKEWSCQPSTHYSMPMTMAMEEMLESVAAEGYAGIIVVSGCGVMEEIAYLVNLLWKRSEPVIFANLMVQGRAGVKEGLMNLHCAVLAALSPGAQNRGVLICSSGELFDAGDAVLADPESPDNAFQSPLRGTIGKMLNGELKFLQDSKRPVFLAVRPKEIPYVEIMWASLGGGDGMLSSLLHVAAPRARAQGARARRLRRGQRAALVGADDTQPRAQPRRGRRRVALLPGQRPQDERLRGLL